MAYNNVYERLLSHGDVDRFSVCVIKRVNNIINGFPITRKVSSSHRRHIFARDIAYYANHLIALQSTRRNVNANRWIYRSRVYIRLEPSIGAHTGVPGSA